MTNLVDAIHYFLELPHLLLCCVALFSFFVSLFLNRVVFRYAVQNSLFDHPDGRRIHRDPTPRLGGAAIFSSIVLVSLTVLAVREVGVLGDEHAFSSLRSWMVVLPGCFIAAATGLIDDIWQISPVKKLFGQVLAASVFLLLSDQPELFLGFPLPPLLIFPLHLLWIVAVINAFNLIDGIDGLATALAVVALLGILASLVLRGAKDDVCIVVTAIAAFAGFYPWNRHPAKMFLGDCGTHVCGFLVGCLAQQTGSKSEVAGTLWIGAVAGAVPLLDMVLAVWRRSARKVSSTLTGTQVSGIFTGDLEHMHHRLLSRGLDVNTIVAVLTLVNALLVLVGLVAVQSTGNWYPISLASLVIALAAFLVFVPRTEIGASIEMLNLLMVRPKSRLLTALAFFSTDFLSGFFGWFLSRALIQGSTGLLRAEDLSSALLLGTVVALGAAGFESSMKPRWVGAACILFSSGAWFLWGAPSLLTSASVLMLLATTRGLTFVGSGFGPGAELPRFFGFYTRLHRGGKMAATSPIGSEYFHEVASLPTSTLDSSTSGTHPYEH